MGRAANLSVRTGKKNLRVAKRRAGRSRAAVCLLSTNPLALPEMRRFSDRLRDRLAVRARHLKLTTGALEHHDLKVPKARIYVLDGFSTGIHTEAVIAGIRSRHPNGRVIVLVPRIRSDEHFSLLQLGVKGLVAYPHAAVTLPRAITTVAGGGIWMPRTLISTFLDRVLPSNHSSVRTPQQRLSRREREVLDCVLQNQSNKEISTTLHIAESTVKFHLAQLFQKFGVRRRADLILQSIQQPL
jgi:DNA-binding NarL/FixJ family response regulator